VQTPNSPGWWLQKLAKKREERLPDLHRLSLYIEGRPPLPKQYEGMRAAYQELAKTARINLAESAVTAVSDRISVRAIRTAVADDFDGDSIAMQIWRENNLDIELADVIENMLGLRDGYMMVGLSPDDPERVIITGEDPRLVVTIHDPVDQSEVRAGLKMFHDPDLGYDFAYLFIRGEAILDAFGQRTGKFENARRYVAKRARKNGTRGILRFSASGFDWDEDAGGASGEELEHRFVPIVRFRNRNGISEFERHTDTLDRINHGILIRMVIALYQAYRLRAVVVDEDDAPDTDEDGREIDYEDVLSSDPGAFLKLPLGAKMWESAQTDLTGILKAVRDDILFFMEETKTPLPAVSDAVQQSAEGAANLKEGNQFKTERTMVRVAASIALVFMIAFLCRGDEDRAKRGSIRTDFNPTSRYSLGEKYDAFSKSSDLPIETRMAETLQFDPERIAIAKAQLQQDALFSLIQTPPGGGSGRADAQAPADAAAQ
jgi:hypothetical protein